MATWSDPIDSSTDPDAPLTSELAKRWDNNVVAAFEVSSGAPRLARRFKTVEGIVADGSTSIDDGYDGVIVDFTGSADSDGNEKFFKFALSSNNGSSYSANAQVSVGSSTDGTTFQALGKVYIDLTSGDYSFLSNGVPSGGGGAGNGTAATPSGTVNRIIFRASAATDELRQVASMVELTGKEAAS